MIKAFSQKAYHSARLERAWIDLNSKITDGILDDRALVMLSHLLAG
jgi:hypothetical protein